MILDFAPSSPEVNWNVHPGTHSLCSARQRWPAIVESVAHCKGRKSQKATALGKRGAERANHGTRGMNWG